MYSQLDVIESGILTCLSEMTVSGGYNYDTGTTNQLDFNKASFPLYNLFLYPEERSLDAASHPNMNSFRNEASFEIYCYNKVSEENYNNQFEIDHILNGLLHDVKKMIGHNPTIKGTCEYFGYERSRRENSGAGDDLLIPKVLVVTCNIYYSEDHMNPKDPAYC